MTTNKFLQGPSTENTSNGYRIMKRHNKNVFHLIISKSVTLEMVYQALNVSFHPKIFS